MAHPGAAPVGTRRWFLAFTNLNIGIEPRCGTGRAILIEIPNASRHTIEAAIPKYVCAGSIIWTDGHASYEWLGQGVKPGQHSEVSGFTWDWVNHKQGGSVRGESLERVSTNGVESLFGSTKKLVRVSGVANVHGKRYALHLAELLWRERLVSRPFLHTTSWEMPTVWLLADLIGNVNKHSSLQDVAASKQMRAHISDELQALRNDCSRRPHRPVGHLPPASVSGPATFSSLKKAVSVVDLDLDDDDVLELPPKRMAPAHVPVVVPHYDAPGPDLPHIEAGIASPGSFAGESADAMTDDDAIASVGSISDTDLPAHRPEPPVELLPATVVPFSYCLRSVRARPLLPDNVQVEPRQPRVQFPPVAMPNGEPREEHQMHVGGTFTIWYYGVQTPQGRERTWFAKSSSRESYCVLLEGRTMLFSRIGRVTSVNRAEPGTWPNHTGDVVAQVCLRAFLFVFFGVGG